MRLSKEDKQGRLAKETMANRQRAVNLVHPNLFAADPRLRLFAVKGTQSRSRNLLEWRKGQTMDVRLGQ